MGGPSPLWGSGVPLFHTQINTRNPRTETSPSEGPVIGAIRESGPPISKIPTFFIPPLQPLSTTVRTSWNMESTPVLHSESACQLRLSIRPLVVALLAKSGPIFDDPDFFCCSPSNHFPLQSELLGWWSLDQFAALNLPVVSIVP